MSEEVLNRALIDMSRWAIRNKSRREKSAFSPPPEAMAGQDPAMATGVPPEAQTPGMPPGMPGMDPSASGGATAPAMGGSMPDATSLAPPAQPLTPETLVQAVTQAVQNAMGAGGKGGKGGAVDIKQILPQMSQDLFQVKRLLLHLFDNMQLQLPPDILDGPARDPVTGVPALGQDPSAQVGPVPVSAAGPTPDATKTAELEYIGTPVASVLDSHDPATQASAVALVARRLAQLKK